MLTLATLVAPARLSINNESALQHNTCATPSCRSQHSRNHTHADARCTPVCVPVGV